MSKVNFSDEFKRDAVRQITERGYAVSEVSERLGVSPHSLYAWKKKFSNLSDSDARFGLCVTIMIWRVFFASLITGTRRLTMVSLSRFSSG